MEVDQVEPCPYVYAKRPPITEAVVELRLAAPIEVDQVEKIKDRLTDEYPVAPQIVQNISMVPGPDNQNRMQVDFGGYRMTSGRGGRNHLSPGRRIGN